MTAKLFLGLLLVGSTLLPQDVLAQHDLGTMLGGNKIDHELGTRGSLESQSSLTQGLWGLSEDEWKAKAMGWVSVAPVEGDGASTFKITIGGGVSRGETKTASWSVAEDGPTWMSPGGRKVAKKLRLILNNHDQTEIECPLKYPLANFSPPVLLGVFQHQGGIECVFRPNSPGES